MGTMTMTPETKGALELSYNGRSLQLPIVKGSEGEAAIDI